MTPLAGQQLLDAEAVRAQLRISGRTFRRLVSRGEIGIVRISGMVRVPEAELEAFLRRRYTPPAIKRCPVPLATVEELLDRVAPRRGTRAGAEGTA